VDLRGCRAKYRALAPTLTSEVDALKVSYPLVMRGGLEIISSLASFAPVICDFKIADVPHMSAMIAKEAFTWGATGVIVHGFVGRQSVAAVCGEAQRQGGEAWVVVEMSHDGSAEFLTPASERMVELALELGAQGVVAPGTRPARIALVRSMVGHRLQIASPGIGTQGGDPAAAVKAGADFLIVGRSIYQAADPAAAARTIRQSLPR